MLSNLLTMRYSTTTITNSCSSVLMNFPHSAAAKILVEPLASFRPGQPGCMLFTSSTMPELHVLHDLSSTGRQTYLPISICNGAAPPFRLASRDLCTFTLVLCMYPSVEHALLQNYYFQLVMVTMCLNVAWHYWNSLETSLKSMYFRVDIVQKQYCLLHNRSSIHGE